MSWARGDFPVSIALTLWMYEATNAELSKLAFLQVYRPINQSETPCKPMWAELFMR
ncbi:MAG: hypothetical protein ABJF07_23915 [Nisaea sp.]|uniref:hypothetical protein n=1 Tax=Nisaea sp. TaxID=2024842 RepID=UPI003262D155